MQEPNSSNRFRRTTLALWVGGGCIVFSLVLACLALVAFLGLGVFGVRSFGAAPPFAGAPAVIATGRPVAGPATVDTPRPAATPRMNQAVPNATASVPPPPTAVAGQAPGDADQQKNTFEEAWKIVNDTYVYPDLNGLDWPGERERMLKLIAVGVGDDQFYAEMNALIDRLNDHHSGFLSPAGAAEADRRFLNTNAYVGIGVVTDVSADKQALMLLIVYPGSAADKAGLKPHDRILKIDGRPAVDQHGQDNVALLRGEPGTEVSVLAQSPGQSARALTIRRAKVEASVKVSTRLLPGPKKIGYMLIPTFDMKEVWLEVRTGLDDLAERAGGRLDGLILDMRINGGGSYTNLSGCLSYFTGGSQGTFVTRSEPPEKFEVTAADFGGSQTVPLVILVSRSTGSFAEVFSGVLQANGRARLVGQTTGGNIEILKEHELSGGSRLILAQSTFKLPDGRNWEGAGLKPDIEAGGDWDGYSDEADPVLAAALPALGE